MDEETLGELRASAPRRWIAVAILGLLGGLLVYLALAAPPATFGWQLFLLVTGAGAIWLADATRRATERTLILTEEGLRDDLGEEIVAVADIVSVSRGTFAFKPSNGFVIQIASPKGRRWQPGVWWRIGRRVGIGGVTPGPQGKAMAQIIEALMAGRAQNAPD